MLDEKMFGDVPQKIHKVVANTLEALEEGTEKVKKSNNRQWGFGRAAVIFGALFLITGITVCSVGALRQNYKERMEEMTREDYEQFYSMWEEEMNREFTNDELARYDELEELYVKNGVFPQGGVKVLEEGEVYNGKGIALDIVNHILYLPEELSDEDLLQLIDYQKKHVYSVYMLNEERINGEEMWRSRVTDMTPEEMEELYKMWVYANGEVSGAFSRNLQEEEDERYDALYEQYEKGLFPEKEITIIRYTEEYGGVGAAFCVQDCTYYIPEETLSDEEMLQIIDFTHRALYAHWKINDEIALGLRDGYPQVVREFELFRLRMEAMTGEDYMLFADMAERGTNRELTTTEAALYMQLEDSYKRRGVFPEGQIKVLETGEAYSGIGVAFDRANGTLFFPADEMSEEELLQLIDFRNKCIYSEYVMQIEAKRQEIAWIDRVEALDYGRMTDYYLWWLIADTEVRGGFSRALSEEESKRYNEIVRKYETEGLYTETEINVESQKDLIGDEVTFYSKECRFYLPDRELTDEEMLQIIDYIHKAQYICEKLQKEVNMGLREEYYIYR